MPSQRLESGWESVTELRDGLGHSLGGLQGLRRGLGEVGTFCRRSRRGLEELQEVWEGMAGSPGSLGGIGMPSRRSGKSWEALPEIQEALAEVREELGHSIIGQGGLRGGPRVVGTST